MLGAFRFLVLAGERAVAFACGDGLVERLLLRASEVKAPCPVCYVEHLRYSS